LTVHTNPYFLRLNFSHRLLDDDENSSAKYDAGSGYLIVTLTKETSGEDFKDLDLLAKLLAPRPTLGAVHRPMIEVVESVDALQDGGDGPAMVTESLSSEHRELREGTLPLIKNCSNLPSVLYHSRTERLAASPGGLRADASSSDISATVVRIFGHTLRLLQPRLVHRKRGK
jgi:hypothetical protein